MGVAALTKRLTDLFTMCWERCTSLPELRDATIHVQKGNKSDCSKLMWHYFTFSGEKKKFRILLDRILVASIVGSVLYESQCGSLAGRDTLDIIFQMQGL